MTGSHPEARFRKRVTGQAMPLSVPESSSSPTKNRRRIADGPFSDLLLTATGSIFHNRSSIARSLQATCKNRGGFRLVGALPQRLNRVLLGHERARTKACTTLLRPLKDQKADRERETNRRISEGKHEKRDESALNGRKFLTHDEIPAVEKIT